MAKLACPVCNFPESETIDSRTDLGGVSIKRRRECLNPKGRHRFSTSEIIISSIVRSFKGVTRHY